MKDDCIFCKIRDGEIPSELLFEDAQVFVIKDIAPKAPVHLLVMPKEHFTFLDNLTPEFHTVIGAMFAAANRMAVASGVAESGYRLVVNQRDDSGQEVPHLHLHVLGGRRMGSMA